MSSSGSAESPRSSNPYGYLRRGHVKLGLIRALAAGEGSKDLAAKHNCTQRAINNFRADHRDQIAAVQADLENEYAGLWIADKAGRVAAYQQHADDIERLLAAELERRGRVGETDDGEVIEEGATDVDAVAKLTKARDRALRSVSEELGHLPSRVRINVTGEKASMHLEGVDLEQL